ncbi:MAG: hypothetical protein IPP69_06505 [Flavobacteriales bacterium]|nr:hypothetical protein [Flavobacteriales bacterium]
MKSIVLFLFGITYSFIGINAQEMITTDPYGQSRYRSFYVTWGYNRAYYNKSDIHFKGDGYDFTLYDVRAEDMPEKFSPSTYLNPTQFTVPQFNFRAGYYFRKNTAISLGWDHMKYHIIPTQLLRIDGNIDESISNLTNYTGQFNNEYILYSSSFMDYHHSDGFNFIRVALERRAPLVNFGHSGKHLIAMNACASIGTMMPWTDFTFFGVNHRNKPHFAGYGASLHAGLRYEFLNYFFVQVAAQAGWSNLPDIMLEDHLPSRADQKIVFFERTWAIGAYIPLKTKTE